MTPTNEAAERLREWLVGQDRPDHHGNDLLDAALAFERQASEAAPSPDPIRAAVEAEWYNGNLSEDTMDRILAAPSPDAEPWERIADPARRFSYWFSGRPLEIQGRFIREWHRQHPKLAAAPSLLQERDRLPFTIGDLVPLEVGEEARAAFFIEVVLTNDPDIDGQWDEALVLVPSVEAISEAVEEFFHRETRPWTARVSASPFAATSTATEEPTDD